MQMKWPVARGGGAVSTIWDGFSPTSLDGTQFGGRSKNANVWEVWGISHQNSALFRSVSYNEPWLLLEPNFVERLQSKSRTRCCTISKPWRWTWDKRWGKPGLNDEVAEWVGKEETSILQILVMACDGFLKQTWWCWGFEKHPFNMIWHVRLMNFHRFVSYPQGGGSVVRFDFPRRFSSWKIKSNSCNRASNRWGWCFFCVAVSWRITPRR